MSPVAELKSHLKFARIHSLTVVQDSYLMYLPMILHANYIFVAAENFNVSSIGLDRVVYQFC